MILYNYMRPYNHFIMFIACVAYCLPGVAPIGAAEGDDEGLVEESAATLEMGDSDEPVGVEVTEVVTETSVALLSPAGPAATESSVDESLHALVGRQAFEAAREKFWDAVVVFSEMRSATNLVPVKVTGVGIEGLMVQYEGLDGSVGIPVESLPHPLVFPSARALEEYNRLLAATDDPARALWFLREQVYPLFKFASLDPRRVGVQGFVEFFLEELLRFDQSKEVLLILGEFESSAVAGVYSSVARRLATQLAREERFQEVYDLVKRFPLNADNLQNASLYLDIANALREAGSVELSRNLFLDVQYASSEELHPEAFLWEAYFFVAQGSTFLAEPIIQRFVAKGEDHALFPLAMMIQGMAAQEAGRHNDAALLLARSAVYSTSNDPWNEELLFRMAKAYSAVDQENAADAVRNQLRFFYPNSIWLERL